jgi:hypothetical protein
MIELLVINRNKKIILGTRRNFLTDIRSKQCHCTSLDGFVIFNLEQVSGRLHVPAALHFVFLGLRTDLVEVAQKKIPDPARKLTPVVHPPAQQAGRL